MKRNGIAALLASWAIAAGGGVAAGGQGICQDVITAVYSSIDTTNCPSVCTTGRFSGPPGLLQNGTSHFVIASLDSSTPIWKYTGQFDLTTKGGSISVLSTGFIDFTQTPPAFGETESLISGTGTFADAGSATHLFSAGSFDGTTFLGTISGKICTY